MISKSSKILVVLFAMLLTFSAISPAQTNSSALGSNVALGKKATQSSEFDNKMGQASVAVDGITDGNFGVGSVTHTSNDGSTDPWWEVDLGAVYELTYLEIYNRSDYQQERLDGFKILVRNSSNEEWKLHSGPWGVEKKRSRRDKSQHVFKLGTNGNPAVAKPQARYLRIQLTGENRILSLAEVKVFGYELGARANMESCYGPYGTLHYSEPLAAGKAILFTQANYRGDCIEFTYQDGNYDYSIENKFNERGYFRFDNDKTFYSMKLGPGIEITVCTAKFLKGTCKSYTKDAPYLGAQELGAEINSFKIYTLNPKNYVHPFLPKDNEVTLCQGRTFGDSCRKLAVGNHDLRGRNYLYIHVGSNVKAQTFSDSNFYGSFEVYPGGSKQTTNGNVKSIRVMNAGDDLAALKPRPTPVPVTPAAPVATVAAATPPVTEVVPPVVNTSTRAANDYRFDGAIRVSTMSSLGLTVQGQNIQNGTPIILQSGLNEWNMLPNGAIVLKSDPRFGLTVLNQNITNGAKIILHTGYNLWTVLSNGAIVLKDNPAFGLTVEGQNLNSNASVILHGGYNTWTPTNSSPQTGNVAPPKAKANHGPPTSNYVWCVNEPYRCNFNGIGTVAFGVNGIFKYRQEVSRGIDCTVAAFGGDPVKDEEKRCYVWVKRPLTFNTTPRETDQEGPPSADYRVCSVEGQDCRFSGTGTVAFGHNKKGGFRYKHNVNGRIQCNKETFGDISPGKAKACYVLVQ